MKIEKDQLRLTDHAYEQYCSRVKEIERETLRDELTSKLNSRQYHKKEEFIQIDGIWWVHMWREEHLIIITCYGKSDFDVPAAKRWAHQHNDRIDLSGGASYVIT